MSTFPDERQTLILARLQRNGRVMAAELATEFQTSEDTIRRDLRDLAAAGRCRRVYGGALPVSPAFASLTRRQSLAPDAKRALGRAAARLVAPGQIAIIDSGSTNLRIAEALPPDMALTVVTNAPAVAAALGGREKTRVVMLGGHVDPDIGACFGARALRDLEGIRADVAFVGTCGLAAEAGLTVFDAEEAAFKERIVASSARIVAALTTDKLGTAAPFAFAPADALHDLLVEAEAPAELLHRLEREGLRMHRAAGTPS